jgi:hypothetical protein
MVYGDSRHYTHECEAAQNSTDGHRELYAAREVRHHTTSTHRTRGKTGDLECILTWIARIQRTDPRRTSKE